MTDICGEVKLARAVIAKAVEDLMAPLPARPKSLPTDATKPERTRYRNQLGAYRAQLRLGETAATFLAGGPELTFWCRVAGYDPHMITGHRKTQALVANTQERLREQSAQPAA